MSLLASPPLEYLQVVTLFSQLLRLYEKKSYDFSTLLVSADEITAYFLAMTPERLRMTAENIGRQIDLISDNGFSFEDDRQTISCFCEVNDLEEPDDFYDVIDNKDIIEIYDKYYIQRYHNFVIDKISSYMSEDLLSHPSYDLYSRAKRVYDEIFALSGQVLNGEIEGLVKSHAGPHLMKEIKSVQKRAFMVEFKFMYGLKNRRSGLTEMVIVSQSARRLPSVEESLAGFI